MFDLSQLHTFGLSAKARNLVHWRDDSRLLIDRDEPHYILAGGSNTVFVDDFDGTLICVEGQGVSVTETDTDYVVTAQAGENWHDLVCALLAKGIDGLENLALIPGTVGAAPIQNIGAYGRELSEFCQSVDVRDKFTGEELQLTRRECQFGYRDSFFKRPEGQNLLVRSVTLALPKTWRPELSYGALTDLSKDCTAQQICEAVINIRSAKLPDPEKIGNAGSFFKNPVIEADHYDKLLADFPAMPGHPLSDGRIKVPAAFLIDKLGYKGYEREGIGCHASQPLVLFNTGEGSGQALLNMAREIRDAVYKRFAIQLHNEVRLVGRTGLVEL
ncbi:UDP-N-acetylmuramate dehydrogenase [Saliniradius amylolyticus]|uniref:UDP-N-acetylenolpyruvoylglucosamine reductase n=1 Tax=Saliniradius amylolyticus TaxID=2183582 RepID=A0A2S2E1L0_9ALTE|nr:UDP-N-acetylmuramate dehydrogenase [Saliniradius amylolyticus]AWL10917.1 UDP-N-acetylmuramate dehydrogenase [Saliniradius amylolyticus]